MNVDSWRWLILPMVFFVLVKPGQAQVSPPNIGFIFPAGGRQGTSFKLMIGGQYLDEAKSVRFSGKGVKAEILGQTRPLTRREITALRRELSNLQKKKDKTPDDRKRIDEIRKKIVPPSVRATPALAEIVTLRVTIDPKAAPGPRQLRLRAKTGMSNPFVFVVGQLPEVTQAKKLVNPEAPQPKVVPVDVTLPTVMNSQIMPGTVDRYRFPARKGQQLVIVAHARSLIPYLADAVPGWFQAALTLYDDSGREVAYSDHFHHLPDPVLFFKVPRDGTYMLEIKDALYRGREDFVYRIEAGELPFVTSIYPLGGKAGQAATVALRGWNLPMKSLTIDAPNMKPGARFLSVRKGQIRSNRVPFAVNTLPEIHEKEQDGGSANAQQVTLPIIINGHIDRPGKWDVFQFEAKKGQQIVAEVRARRLDSPLDSVLKLIDSQGKTIAYSDDWEDRGHGLLTHHADSRIIATLPEAGNYFVHLGDGQSQGSPAHAYRLRLSAPRPDFELRVTPCSINARPGSTLPITVYALRKDGFEGDIYLKLTYTPVDFHLGGAKIPAKQDEVRVTLHVPTTERPVPIDLVLEGHALINGKRVVRIATPAEEMMQAFIYHHLVPAKDLMVTIDGQARSRFPARLLPPLPVRIRPGGTALVRIAIPRASSKNRKIRLELSDPPEGITLKKSLVNENGAILMLEADAEKAVPGLRANLIVEAYPEARAGRKASKQPLGTLPAIPFEILKLSR